MSDPILLGTSGGVVQSIEARTVTPGRTAIRLYYRIADRVISRDPENAIDERWREVPSDGTPEERSQGRFLQLKAELLSDAARVESPRLQEIVVTYQPFLPPPAPRGLTATPIPGGVRLEWNPVRLTDIQDYRVYFGERPGRYTGTEGVASPVGAGSVTELEINGLRPDHPYVFAVESRDRYGQRSPLSGEVEMRAGRVHE